MEWKRRADDPVDRQTLREACNFMILIRHFEHTGKALDYVLRENAGKRVLAIGVCRHSRTHARWESLVASAVALPLRVAA
jgi:hypothetical protein